MREHRVSFDAARKLHRIDDFPILIERSDVDRGSAIAPHEDGILVRIYQHAVLHFSHLVAPAIFRGLAQFANNGVIVILRRQPQAGLQHRLINYGFSRRYIAIHADHDRRSGNSDNQRPDDQFSNAVLRRSLQADSYYRSRGQSLGGRRGTGNIVDGTRHFDDPPDVWNDHADFIFQLLDESPNHDGLFDLG